MIFFVAPPSSTPITSVLPYTRKLGPPNAFCNMQIASSCWLATTVAAGKLRPTSSAWLGPDKIAVAFTKS